MNFYPRNFHYNVQYVARRVLAISVDLIILNLVGRLIGTPCAALFHDLGRCGVFFGVGIFVAYFLIFEGLLSNSASPGKRIMKLRVSSISGCRLGLVGHFSRITLLVVPWLLSSYPYILEWIFGGSSGLAFNFSYQLLDGWNTINVIYPLVITTFAFFDAVARSALLVGYIYFFSLNSPIDRITGSQVLPDKAPEIDTVPPFMSKKTCILLCILFISLYRTDYEFAAKPVRLEQVSSCSQYEPKFLNAILKRPTWATEVSVGCVSPSMRHSKASVVVTLEVEDPVQSSDENVSEIIREFRSSPFRLGNDDELLVSLNYSFDIALFSHQLSHYKILNSAEFLSWAK